tara:strand:+ start:693 stop:998 length:306 start_codon:yes stop_codon:yes gene_type:complete
MSKPGLYANIHAKKARIKAGSGETMRKVGTKGAPTKQAFTNSAKTAKTKPIKKNMGGTAAPKVGAQKFPNTSGGFHQAQKTAKATGQQMTMRKGGKVKKRR